MLLSCLRILLRPRLPVSGRCRSSRLRNVARTGPLRAPLRVTRERPRRWLLHVPRAAARANTPFFTVGGGRSTTVRAPIVAAVIVHGVRSAKRIACRAAPISFPLGRVTRIGVTASASTRRRRCVPMSDRGSVQGCVRVARRGRWRSTVNGQRTGVPGRPPPLTALAAERDTALRQVPLSALTARFAAGQPHCVADRFR